jgi:hypothetical protein
LTKRWEYAKKETNKKTSWIGREKTKKRNWSWR